MKKGLFMLAATAAMLTSCLDEIKEDENWQNVSQGLQIYEWTGTQQHVAMAPVDATVRLALLLAEAEKQRDPETGELPDPMLVTVGSRPVVSTLFASGAQIESLGDGDYRVTFAPQAYYSYYECKGTMTVHTGGRQLADTDGSGENRWTVTLDPEFKILVYVTNGVSSRYQNVAYKAEEIALHRASAADYAISVSHVVAGSVDNSYRSDWTGAFTLTAPSDAESLAYSDCAGKTFGWRGDASGRSLYVFDGTLPLTLQYRVENGSSEKAFQLLGGRESCIMIGSYPSVSAPSVDVEWALSGDGRVLTQTVLYDGYTYSQTYSR